VSRRETNARLRDPIMVRSTSSGFSICYYCSFGFFWIIFYPFPHYKALLFYLITSPVPTCLVHNCETSRRFTIPICCHPCLEINSLWSPSALLSLIGQICHVHMDNIIIWSNSVEEHEQNVRRVLKALHVAHLYCSSKKTELFADGDQRELITEQKW